MNLSKNNDLSLVAQVIAGANGRAFGCLVERHQLTVRRYFLHQTLGDTMLSDDLAQDTFIRAYNSISQFQQLSSFKTWLMSIAYRVWIDYLRTRKPTTEIDTNNNSEQSDYSEKNYRVDTSLDIYTALSRLTDIERTCITLFYIDGLSGNDISQATGLPPATVRSHIHRGKQQLSSFLKQNGYG